MKNKVSEKNKKGENKLVLAITRTFRRIMKVYFKGDFRKFMDMKQKKYRKIKVYHNHPIRAMNCKKKTKNDRFFF